MTPTPKASYPELVRSARSLCGVGAGLFWAFSCRAPVSAEPPEPAAPAPVAAVAEPEPAAERAITAWVGSRDVSVAAAYLPADVDWLMSANLTRALQLTTIKAALLETVSSSEDMETLGVLRDCGYVLEDVHRATAGGWMDRLGGGANESQFVMVIEGRAIAARDKIDCISRASVARGDRAIVLEQRGGYLRLSDDGVEEVDIWAIGENTVIVAEGVTPERIEGVLDGRAPTAAGGAVSGAFGYADLGAEMLFIADFEASRSRRPVSSPSSTGFSRLRSVAVGLRPGREGGLDVDARMAFSDAVDSARSMEQIEREFAGFSSLMTMMGISSETVAAIEFSSREQLGGIFVPLSAADLQAMRKMSEGSSTVVAPQTQNAP